MNKIICGDSLTELAKLDAGIVQTCVTSPPYYGLRDYGVTGQIGLEATPDEYIARLVAVFREMRRVLKDDGTLWVNIGDSYSTNPGNGRGGENCLDGGIPHRSAMNKISAGLKPKDLIGIPWMLAFALRADGWYLRSDIIWHKPNPMPESVTDRPTKAHEYIFLLSKRDRYYYDADAIKERAIEGEDLGILRSLKAADGQGPTDRKSINKRLAINPNNRNGNPSMLRNKRDVWTVTTKPFSGCHFATFPRDLIVPCILAGCRPGDVVLDPFGGSGTTAQTAQELGREYITIELNQKYVDEIIKPRLLSTNVPLAGLS